MIRRHLLLMLKRAKFFLFPAGTGSSSYTPPDIGPTIVRPVAYRTTFEPADDFTVRPASPRTRWEAN